MYGHHHVPYYPVSVRLPRHLAASTHRTHDPKQRTLQQQHTFETIQNIPDRREEGRHRKRRKSSVMCNTGSIPPAAEGVRQQPHHSSTLTNLTFRALEKVPDGDPNGSSDLQPSIPASLMNKISILSPLFADALSKPEHEKDLNSTEKKKKKMPPQYGTRAPQRQKYTLIWHGPR